MIRQAALALLATVTTLTVSAANAADTYVIDPEHTFPSLEFSHMGLSVWRGRFNKSSGTVVLDRKARTGTADIQVETNSIDFGLASMHDFAVKEDWLNVAKYPHMTYQGAIRFEGETPVGVDGQLTLKGITKPLALKINTFKCVPHPMFPTKEICGADVEGELNRADFGMAQYTENGMGRIVLKIQVEGQRSL